MGGPVQERADEGHRAVPQMPQVYSAQPREGGDGEQDRRLRLEHAGRGEEGRRVREAVPRLGHGVRRRGLPGGGVDAEAMRADVGREDTRQRGLCRGGDSQVRGGAAVGEAEGEARRGRDVLVAWAQACEKGDGGGLISLETPTAGTVPARVCACFYTLNMA